MHVNEDLLRLARVKHTLVPLSILSLNWVYLTKVTSVSHHLSTLALYTCSFVQLVSLGTNPGMLLDKTRDDI